jgi:nucleoside-diphosphate-sugar epimerase
MSRIAVIGAAGFIGSRAVALLRDGGHHVVPVVRPGRGAATCVEADARDEEALTITLRGCDAVLSSIAGDPDTIVGCVEPIYRAAERAGVRRIIQLSTSAVHGQAPMLGTDERSPLSLDQPFPYNIAKIRAEQRLHALRQSGTVEVVMLRPGIVYGPRSRWIAGFADQLLAGRAQLFDRGEGICNAIYVDNVVHAIGRAIAANVPPAEAFLINDAGRVTWRALFDPVATALGFDLDTLPQLSSTETLLAKAAFSERMPLGLGAKLKWAGWVAVRRGGGATESDATEQLREMALLQSCAVQLPSDKARSILGYQPPIGFEEGCRRSVAWLAEAGYPVVAR